MLPRSAEHMNPPLPAPRTATFLIVCMASPLTSSRAVLRVFSASTAIASPARTTPYTFSACSRETIPFLTSSRTLSGSLSFGSPHPPPPEG